ncbi:MAG: hypothetical protein PVI86_12085 [Phycisphaerae bacterium]|jgi:hypothetical protein
MIHSVSQSDPLTDVMQAVRDHFTRGGTLGSVLLVVLVLCIPVGLAYLIARSARSQARADAKPAPRHLFRNLVTRLRLTPAQRTCLEDLSRDPALAHPTALLLSRTLFDQHASTWLDERKRRRRGHIGAFENEMVADLRSRLFPTD